MLIVPHIYREDWYEDCSECLTWGKSSELLHLFILCCHGVFCHDSALLHYDHEDSMAATAHLIQLGGSCGSLGCSPFHQPIHLHSTHMTLLPDQYLGSAYHCCPVTPMTYVYSFASQVKRLADILSKSHCLAACSHTSILEVLTSAGERTTHSDRPSTNTPLLRSSRMTRFCLSGFSKSLITYKNKIALTCCIILSAGDKLHPQLLVCGCNVKHNSGAKLFSCKHRKLLCFSCPASVVAPFF